MRDDRDDRRDFDDPRDREELDERVAELEALVRELQAELGEPPRGPLGLPRPPTPGEVLSFTGEYAIPTAISVLEANVRALRALQQVIRVLDPDRSAVGEERDRLETRAADASKATLDRLEDALSDVETVVRESDLPREGEARDILEDARRINRDIRDRVARSQREADEARDRQRGRGRDRPGGREASARDRDFEARSTSIEVTDADESDSREGDREDDADEDDAKNSGQVDVDAELRSIKDEIERREERREEWTADSGDGGPGDGDAEDAGESNEDAGEPHSRDAGGSRDAGDDRRDSGDGDGDDREP